MNKKLFLVTLTILLAASTSLHGMLVNGVPSDYTIEDKKSNKQIAVDLKFEFKHEIKLPAQFSNQPQVSDNKRQITENNVSISMSEPDPVGLIKVDGQIDEKNQLHLRVSSEYGIYRLNDEIKNPMLNTISLESYEHRIEETSEKHFALCLLYKEKANYSDESSEQFNRITYIFTPDGVLTYNESSQSACPS